ncbi:MAG TPA: C45 family peptidase [Thermoanaerobaculia bacterium]|nr:C45 family peptidase [Thermoanaerobaculia bacterium]
MAAALFLTTFGSSCAPARPESVQKIPQSAVVEQQGGVRRLGKSYLARREGILEARFVGSAYDRGYARGALAYEEIIRGERTIQKLIRRFFPSAIGRFFLRRTVAANLRESLPEIPLDRREEIVGLSDAIEPDPFPNEWNPFARHLALHALHDLSQRYADDTPLGAACTGFAASGAATADGHTLLARNFDFEADTLFDREKIVAYVVPDGGIPYLTVTFAGLTGVTTGFNREGIGIAVHAWSGGPTASAGEPATLVAADVLEHASTLDDAIHLLGTAPVFVSDIYLVADGNTGELAAVEKTPQGFAVRRARELLAVANHPETPRFAGARTLNATSTSPYRRARLEEVLSAAGRLDVPKAVGVLRDRRGLGGRDIGPGNRNAINALIASHSVVLDLTARKAWVADAPHGLGRYVAYSLDLGVEAEPADSRLASLEALAIPPDPWLLSGGFADFQSARKLFFQGRAAFKSGRPAAAEADADAALRLAPGLVEALALRAQARAALGLSAGAREDCDAAFERDPAPPTFRRSLETLCAAVSSGKRPPANLAYPVSPSDPPLR